MWLLSITQRIDIRIAAGQQDAVQTGDHGLDVIGARNQTDMHGSAACSLDRLAVMTRKVEPVRGVFDAHRDADAWSCLHHFAKDNSLLRYHKPTARNCITTTLNASLTYIQTSSYSLVKETCTNKQIGFAARLCCSSGKTLT